MYVVSIYIMNYSRETAIRYLKERS